MPQIFSLPALICIKHPRFLSVNLYKLIYGDYDLKTRLKKYGALFVIGAAGYCLIELIWRKRTHWSMALTGGACFAAFYNLCLRLCKKRRVVRCAAGCAMITAVEFLVGVVVNLWLKLKVWDYSARPFNILGQICPLFTFLWLLLCFPLSFLCEHIHNRAVNNYNIK